MANEVFISYSRKDFEKVKAVKEEIDRFVGIDCWMDLKGIEGGDRYKKVIISAINRHNTLLFMLTNNSMNSRFAMKELEFAASKGKRIVLVDLEHTQLNDDFLFDYSEKDNIDWNDPLQHEKLINNLRTWFPVNSTIKKDEVYDVFISYYINTGHQLAKSIHQLLTKEGYTVFFNEDSVREGLVDENILIHVKRCRDFILIIDTQFAKKMFCQENDWVNTELSEAIKRGNGIVNIIPILLQPDLSLSNDIFINYDKLFFQEPITVFDLIGNGDMLFERLISNRTYVNEKNAKRTIVNCDYSTNAEQTIQQMTNNPLFTAFVQLVKSSENI